MAKAIIDETGFVWTDDNLFIAGMAFCLGNSDGLFTHHLLRTDGVTDIINKLAMVSGTHLLHSSLGAVRVTKRSEAKDIHQSPDDLLTPALRSAT